MKTPRRRGPSERALREWGGVLHRACGPALHYIMVEGGAFDDGNDRSDEPQTRPRLRLFHGYSIDRLIGIVEIAWRWPAAGPTDAITS